jgi:hypothetical protein
MTMQGPRGYFFRPFATHVEVHRLDKSLMPDGAQFQVYWGRNDPREQVSARWAGHEEARQWAAVLLGEATPLPETREAYRYALAMLVNGSTIDSPEAIVEHTGMPAEEADVVWRIALHARSTSTANDEQAGRALAHALAKREEGTAS